MSDDLKLLKLALTEKELNFLFMTLSDHREQAPVVLAMARLSGMLSGDQADTAVAIAVQILSKVLSQMAEQFPKVVAETDQIDAMFRGFRGL